MVELTRKEVEEIIKEGVARKVIESTHLVIVEGMGIDSLEYKASTKDIGFKIYGDFDTEEGRVEVESKLNYLINLRIRLMASIGLPLPGRSLPSLPPESFTE